VGVKENRQKLNFISGLRWRLTKRQCAMALIAQMII